MALQNLCNLIWGMARLAEHPGPELMRRFLQKTEELLELSGFENEEDVGQGIANTLWALAVLDELRPDFVERVSARAAACASHRSQTQTEQDLECQDRYNILVLVILEIFKARLTSWPTADHAADVLPSYEQCLHASQHSCCYCVQVEYSVFSHGMS